MPQTLSFETLRDHYLQLFGTAEIVPGHEALVEENARRIVKQKERYEAFAKATGIPWYVIGCLELLDGQFDGRVTDEFRQWSDWSSAAILYKLEAHAGQGHLREHPEVNTPYLWAGTNHDTRGDDAGGEKREPNRVANQVGAAAILMALDRLLGGAAFF